VTPRFLADAMLERLARWLRVLGADVVSATGEPDAALVARAAAEERVLLTRDRRLPREHDVRACLVLDAVAPLAQLREVVDRCGLVPGNELFTRCLLCNTPLDRMDADERVPADVRARGEPVRRCATCGRVYWEGVHTRRMRAAVARALAPPGA